MNEMFSFNPEEKRQRMAQALQNYILPEQKVEMPQTPSSGSGVSSMDIIKMMGKKKPEIGTGMTADSASMLPF